MSLPGTKTEVPKSPRYVRIFRLSHDSPVPRRPARGIPEAARAMCVPLRKTTWARRVALPVSRQAGKIDRLLSPTEHSGHSTGERRRYIARESERDPARISPRLILTARVVKIPRYEHSRTIGSSCGVTNRGSGAAVWLRIDIPRGDIFRSLF